MSHTRLRVAALLAAGAAASATGLAFPAGALATAGATSPAAQRASVHHTDTYAIGPAPLADVTDGQCHLGNGVQHVVFIGFDNFHLRRDNSKPVDQGGDGNLNTNPNIPSDLEQVPALYNFLRGGQAAQAAGDTWSTDKTSNYANGRSYAYGDGTTYPGGTVLANHHTPIISHTSVDFTTVYSGLYGDRHGVPIAANSFGVYTGQSGTASVGSNSAFSYWTDPLPNAASAANDKAPVLVTGTKPGGGYVNTPAPWVPFTRAGCDVGAIAATGFVPENTNTISSLLGSTPKYAVNTADYVGVSVHCALGSSVCGTGASDSSIEVANDVLPDEPGGYNGYRSLLGAVNVHRAINDKLGNGANNPAVSLLRPGSSVSTFPGFDAQTGNYTLGLTLAMQKAGIPVTFGYLSGAHFCHTGNTREDFEAKCPNNRVAGSSDANTALGSGQAQYRDVLTKLNSDFTAFFDQAKAAGLTTSNTEFVFYSDENDTVPESAPIEGNGCDGITTYCTWNNNDPSVTGSAGSGTSSTSVKSGTPTSGQIGEVTVGVDTLLSGISGGRSKDATLGYFLNNDTAPDFSVYPDSGATTPPTPDNPRVRNLQYDLSQATYTDPFTGSSKRFVVRQAGQTELGALHMITADPLRSPSTTVFAPPEVYAQKASCTSTLVSCSDSAFAYVHGNIDPRPTTTWAGFAGPGVKNLGVDSTDWTNHVDLRPTLLSLVGLQDDYTGDGRVITQIETAAPAAATTSTALALADRLTKLNSPVYESSPGADDGFGKATLAADTTALAYDPSTDAQPGHRTDVESRIAGLTASRDGVTGDIKAKLAQAAFGGAAIDETTAQQDITKADCVLRSANQLKAYAAGTGPAPTDSCSALPPADAPEISHAAVLVLVGGVLAAGGAFVVIRRRENRNGGAAAA